MFAHVLARCFIFRLRLFTVSVIMLECVEIDSSFLTLRTICLNKVFFKKVDWIVITVLQKLNLATNQPRKVFCLKDSLK